MPGIVRQSESYHYVDQSLSQRSAELEDSYEASEDYADLILPIATRGVGLTAGTMLFD